MPYGNKSHNSGHHRGDASTSRHSSWFSKHLHKDKAEPEPVAKSPFYSGAEFERLFAKEQEVERQRMKQAGLPDWVIDKKLADSSQELERLENEEWEHEEEERCSRFPMPRPLPGEWNSPRTLYTVYENQTLRHRYKSMARDGDMELLQSGISCREILERKREGRLGGATEWRAEGKKKRIEDSRRSNGKGVSHDQARKL